MTTLISHLSAGRKAEVFVLGILFFTYGGLTGILSAQSAPGESDQFEVASIRRGGTNGGRPAIEFTPGGGVRATNVTLKLLIQIAYDIRPEQLSGGPAWTDSDQYTVTAKGPEHGPVPSAAAQEAPTRKRLQALLDERFHLALKREASAASGYALKVEKNGHKMILANDPELGRLRQVGRWEIRAEGVEMSMLARFLSVHLRGTVVNQTGLEGRYTFHLNWNPGVPVPSALDGSASGLAEESLIPAVQEQLGLKLERQKVATDRYTIERADKPTEN
jgi:bla regulator protein BlaR1